MTLGEYALRHPVGSALSLRNFQLLRRLIANFSPDGIRRVHYRRRSHGFIAQASMLLIPKMLVNLRSAGFFALPLAVFQSARTAAADYATKCLAK